MKQINLIVLIMLFSISFAGEEVIQAGIKYNETTAKIEAFKDIKTKLDKDEYKDYLKDPNYKENIEFIKNNILSVESSRELCPFYLRETLASYAVSYYDNPLNTYYYNIFGNLIKIDYINQNSYPKKVLGYSRYGNLISVAFEADENEQFVYDEKGNLEAHWIGSQMVNKNNKEPRFLKLKRWDKKIHID